MEMKKDVIVYGLGNLYRQYKEVINETYNIIGYCDKDESKLNKIKLSIKREELASKRDYDAILVMPENFEVVEDLVNNLNISREKIIYFCATEDFNTYGSEKPSSVFYGQWGDDAILALMFEKIGKKIEEIKYLEIGVYDPIRISNTFYFSKRGANGVLVDANPAIKNKCNMVRANDLFLNYAVSEKTLSRKAKFYIADIKAISALRVETIKAHEENAVIEKCIEVDVIGINDLLEKIGFVPDLVSMDIEGEDWKVIQTWDFEKYRPTVIAVELKGKEVVNYMKQKGYRWFTTHESNSFFIENSFANEV